MELTISGIRKKFVSHGEAVFDLDLPLLRFKEGSINYVMGHNGSGKSLFLKLLSGEIHPTDGEVIITEQGLSLKPIDIAIVRQRTEDNLCLDLTVEENILLRLHPTRLREKLLPKKYLRDKILRVVGEQDVLTKKMTQPCLELSGGQKQKLAFHCAIANEATILCLDEFLTATDYYTSVMLRNKAKEYVSKCRSYLIVVSHDFEVALQDADKIFILNNGKLTHLIERGHERWNKQDLIQMVHFGR